MPDNGNGHVSAKRIIAEWGQPILIGLVLASVAWVGENVTNVRTELSEVRQDFAAIQEELQYTSRMQSNRIEKLNTRVDDIEARVAKIEDGTIAEIVRRYVRDAQNEGDG